MGYHSFYQMDAEVSVGFLHGLSASAVS